MKKYLILFIIYFPTCCPSQPEYTSLQEPPATLLQLTERTLSQTRENLKNLQEKLPKERQSLLQRPYKQWDLLRVDVTMREINMDKHLLTMRQHGTQVAEKGNIRLREIIATKEKCVEHDKILTCLNEELLLIQERERLIQQQSNFYNQVESELIKARSSLKPWAKVNAISSDLLTCTGTCESARIIFNIDPPSYYTAYMPVIYWLVVATKIVGKIGTKYVESTVTHKMSQLSQRTTS